MTIGELIKDYCDRANITRMEFAEYALVTPLTVKNIIDRNKLPSVPALKGIASVLGITFMELIHEHYSTLESMETRTIK